jgi:hypothetical protein
VKLDTLAMEWDVGAICYYIRTGEEALEILKGNPDAIFGDLAGLPRGSEVIDIDKAYDALAWLASPVKRADTLHMARLIHERDWPHSQIAESAARLNEMVVDDAYAAIEGLTDERADGFDLGLGDAAVFLPDRVRSLADAISALDEGDLRRNADFPLMDEQDVQPSGWLEEGEQILSTYTLPALRRLKSFYEAASRQNQTVLVARG